MRPIFSRTQSWQTLIVAALLIAPSVTVAQADLAEHRRCISALNEAYAAAMEVQAASMVYGLTMEASELSDEQRQAVEALLALSEQASAANDAAMSALADVCETLR